MGKLSWVKFMISFQRLRDIREDHDLNQNQLSQILGVKRSTYSLWELGISIIPLKNLVDFCDYFNVSMDYVLGLSNNKGSKCLIKGLDLKVLGNNLRDIRLKKGLSQENIASMFKITQPAVVRYEHGLVTISISNLYKYSKEFNISINELCGKNSTSN